MMSDRIVKYRFRLSTSGKMPRRVRGARGRLVLLPGEWSVGGDAVRERFDERARLSRASTAAEAKETTGFANGW